MPFQVARTWVASRPPERMWRVRHENDLPVTTITSSVASYHQLANGRAIFIGEVDNSRVAVAQAILPRYVEHVRV